MKCSHFLIFFVIIHAVFGAPYYEDDEYDDDPELPDRQEVLQKLQEQDDLKDPVKYQELPIEDDTSNEVSSTTPSATPTEHQHTLATELKPPEKWVHLKAVRGYHILSDGPVIQTEYVKTKPMLRIRIVIPDTIRDVEKSITSERDLELKIRNWNKIHKVHVKVPFGYQPQDLIVAETRDNVDILAPIYSDVDESEFKTIIDPPIESEAKLVV